MLQKIKYSITDWFISDYLNQTNDFIDQARIKLLYRVLSNTSVMLIILNVLTLYFQIYFSLTLSLISLMIFAICLYLLKFKQNYKASSIILLNFSFLAISLILLFEYKIISAYYILFLFALDVFSIFLLGIAWGLFFGFASVLVIGIYIHYFMFDNFHTESVYQPGMLWITFLSSIIALMILIIVSISFIQVRQFIEKMYHAKNIELANANDVAEKALQAQELFITNTSHEIRTPMNAIIGFTQLLLKKELPKEQEEYLESIKFSSEHLLTIINDILDYSKLSAGKIVLENSNCHLPKMLDRVMNIFQIQAQNKNLKLQLHLDKYLPETIWIDEQRLNQILVNLLGNALKFTYQGIVTLKVTLEDESEYAYTIKFSVQDTGIGIPKENQSQIFEKFIQLDASSTRSENGTGLGLAISSNLVTIFGSELHVSSELGVGSDFYFKLTIPKTETIIEERILLPSEKITWTQKNYKILLVDDNFLNRKLLLHTLQALNTNFVIEQAKDGVECLKILESQEFDIIFMDIHMPHLDGMEATKQIRSLYGKATKIIGVTASVLNINSESYTAAGFDCAIMKPFNVDALILEVQKLFSSNASKNALPIPDKTLPSFNFAELQKITTTKEEFVQLIHFILSENDKTLSNISYSNRTNDWDLVKFHLHHLKNTSLFLGNEKFLAEISSAENLALEKSENELEKSILDLISKWQIIKNDIKSTIE